MGDPDPSLDRKRALLDDAIAACTGERHSAYGKPEDTFGRVADFWNAYLEMRPKTNAQSIESWEVAVFMILMKLARIVNQPSHRDSWLDIAGYAACGADITEAFRVAPESVR